MISLKSIASPVGNLVIGTTEIGICFLDFEDNVEKYNKLSILSDSLNQSYQFVKSNIILDDCIDQLKQYFNGNRLIFEIPLDYNGTEFQKEVWKQLLLIPYGSTSTYKDIADQINQTRTEMAKTSPRAVGNANGSNRINIIIPCHRVIASTGKLGGYGGGIDRKQLLLRLERNQSNNRFTISSLGF
ncbi:MAG: methylated-DNA--[protein]-cysteine S-methyltransferase [Candidatus Heimdallarchaeota archaeon]|nr:methylated-DNA--[protein]-cysteine S-methyltransferase [Candidatus Heimdallarchaeota archaeon]MDH5646532.1 methylated-DNA--[protein]-cysteine S-methyltransferase [Candidatus Heimdallarchaeota archaeon]